MKVTDQIISFFLENRELIAIPITAILSAYLVTTLREKQDRKNQHLKEIKDKVFEPLKEGIDRYYLPTLEKKLVNIGINGKPKRNKFLTKEDYKKADRRLEFMFTILEPKEASSRHGTLEPLGKLPSFVPDTKFYLCVKKKHFPFFIQRWEEFKQKFDTYNKTCLEIAKKIKKEIKNQINLPPYNGGSITTPYVFEHELALFVLKKSLQENYSDLLTVEEESPLTTLYIDSKMVARGENPQEIKKCEEEVKELVQRNQIKNQTEKLAKQADALIPKVKTLRDEIERLLKQKRLPGKCEYT